MDYAITFVTKQNFLEVIFLNIVLLLRNIVYENSLLLVFLTAVKNSEGVVLAVKVTSKCNVTV